VRLRIAQDWHNYNNNNNNNRKRVGAVVSSCHLHRLILSKLLSARVDDNAGRLSSDDNATSRRSANGSIRSFFALLDGSSELLDLHETYTQMTQCNVINVNIFILILLRLIM